MGFWAWAHASHHFVSNTCALRDFEGIRASLYYALTNFAGYPQVSQLVTVLDLNKTCPVVGIVAEPLALNLTTLSVIVLANRTDWRR